MNKKDDISNPEKQNQDLTFFKIIADSSSDWIIFYDSNKEIKYISPACEKISGYKKDDFLSDRELFLKIIHPLDREIMQNHKNEAFDKNQYCELEFRVITKSGETKWIQHQCQNIFDEKENYIGKRSSNRDITKEKIKEHERIQNLNYLELFFEKSLNGCYFVTYNHAIDWNSSIIKNKDLELVIENQTLTKINEKIQHQYKTVNQSSLEQLIKKKFTANIETGKTILRNIFENGKLRYETEEYKITGEKFWIEGDYICLYDDERKIIGHFCMQNDITSKKKKEFELKEAKELLEAIIDNLPIGLQIFDKNGFSRRFNRKFQQLLDLPALSTGIGEFNVFTNPYSVENYPIEAYKDVFENKIIRIVENKLNFDTPLNDWTQKRDINYFQETIFPILDETGEIKNVIALVVDITNAKLSEIALKETEERWNFAFSANKDGVWDWNLKTNQVYFSNTWKEMLGYDIDDFDNNVKAWARLMHPDDLTKSFEDINHHLTGKTEFYRNEQRLRCKDGSYKWILNRGKVIEWDINNKPIRFIGTHTDITETKKSQQKLLEANATKDKMFSIIAHDLINPFNALIGLSDIILEKTEEFTKTEIKNLVQLINDASKSTFQLLENLLTWSRSQREVIEYKPEIFNISDVIKSVILIYKYNIEKKNIEVKTEFNHKNIAIADLNMVKTIIRNLISNAIKFSQKDGKIMVKTSDIKNYIQINIIDFGVGIAPENIDKLFDISQNFTTKGTLKEKGSGLGLILCKDFIEKNKGQLFVKSEIDKGSTFTFTLPIYDELE
jgi:PAS domain S-box-containing protein